MVTHDAKVAIAFDKGGYASVLAESSILDGRLTEGKVPMNVAYHGFVAAMGDYFVSSIASEELVVGEAFSGYFLVAGCKEGVVALDTSRGAEAYAMLPYPADFPAGHTGTLLGSPAMQIFLGNYGAASVVIVDPTAERHFTRVELSFRRVDFILDPAKPQMAYILTEDGTLHRLNMLSAQIERSARITQPYSMDGDWRDPRPRLAIADDRLILTDPLEAALRIVDTEDLSEIRTIAVEGIPYNVIAVGGSGLTH